MTKYMVAGAFQDITSDRNSFANSSTWLDGLAAAGPLGARIFGVPYYAGSRVVTYRTDLFKKASIKVPTSLAEFTAAARKLARQQGDRRFSPVYIAGTDWYFAMGFVYDNGGSIARQVSGKWKGTLASPKCDRGTYRVQELLPRRVACEQDDRRDEAESVRRLRAGECRLDGRSRLVQLLRRRQVQGARPRSS